RPGQGPGRQGRIRAQLHEADGAARRRVALDRRTLVGAVPAEPVPHLVDRDGSRRRRLRGWWVVTHGVLSGIRVLDFSRFQQGPYATLLLADLGAEVVRIERPGGDWDRNL